mmetsp:Transcript_59868/g.67812  ORF Transcript_59868/g.67812 Transcript_59868/m.67812 type:complete len:665 (+) Transcript_59868:26-2020(+)
MGGVLSCLQKDGTTAAVTTVKSVPDPTGTTPFSRGLDAALDAAALDAAAAKTIDEEDDEIDDKNGKKVRRSTVYFEAFEEYADLVEAAMPYPSATTKKVGRASNVTMENPASLLRVSFNTSTTIIEERAKSRRRVTTATTTIIEEEEEDLRRRPTVVLKERLTTDMEDATAKERNQKAGYPGELSADELEACLEFRRRLNDKGKSDYDPIYRVMVYLNVDVDASAPDGNSNGSEFAGQGPEEEAFALCRFLRARQFNVDDTFAMMEEHVELFKGYYEEHNLWRSLEKNLVHLGCPLSLFWNQFPMIDYGIAKNGSYIVYMKAGQIHLEDGFDCIQNTEASSAAFVDRYLPMAWWILCSKFCDIMHRVKQEQTAATGSTQDEEFVVLAEAVIIVDLTDLKRSFFSARTMEYLKQVFGVIQCFPEILNRVIVVNVPYFFTFIWTILKHFVDARTVQKIGFFSTTASAKKNLLQLIDSEQLLQEFGGTNPATYDEVLTTQMIRDSNTTGTSATRSSTTAGVTTSKYTRFIIERYNTNDHKKKRKNNFISLRTFELQDKETAQLTVYTQAPVHVDTTLDDDLTTTSMKFLLVDAAHSEMGVSTTGGATTTSTTTTQEFGQPAATTLTHSIVHGPGSFKVVSMIPEFILSAAGGGVGDNEQYLVVVSIL